jgi:hypothetical protein
MCSYVPLVDVVLHSFSALELFSENSNLAFELQMGIEEKTARVRTEPEQFFQQHHPSNSKGPYPT